MKYKCCLCNLEFIGYGNNPEPLSKTGRCCDDCNKVVIYERVRKLKNG